MKLNTLLKAINIQSSDKSEVTYITDNSQKVCSGCIFVCIRGARFDGHTAAAGAVKSGAVAVICERDLGLRCQVVVKDSRSAYARLCSAFFGEPEKKMKIIGITGTNGKTTSAFIIKSILESLGKECGLIGTVKNCVGAGVEYPAVLTTPDPYDLFGLFSEMVKNGCEYCVMEVSSQALHQRRVEGVRFAAALFTNLTQDHLDYHGTMENYMAAKHILFENCEKAIVNSDDAAAEYMLSDIKGEKVRFSLKDSNSDYFAKNVISSSEGVKYEIEGTGNASFPVPGSFSVYNSLGAAVTVMEMGFYKGRVLSALKGCKGVPGRMETVPVDRPFTVIIDYAHTPDGLENVLKSVKGFARGRVISVFGCGGDRDKTKRPIMGEIGSSLSDIAIITSDNPRTEEPQEIINDIMAGVTKKRDVFTICDRTKAIKKALEIAGSGDVIVLCGKGHETYQILKEGKIHYDEREVVRSICSK